MVVSIIGRQQIFVEGEIGRLITSDPIDVAEHVQRWSALQAIHHLPEFRDQLIVLGGAAELALLGSTLPPLELNPYAYVANNPLRWIDPTGESISDGFGFGSSRSRSFQCEDDDNKNKKKKHCAALRDNIINQTCKSIRNPKKKFACFAAAWATYAACLAQD